MKKLIAGVVVFAVVLMALAGSSSVAAQESAMDPAAVVEAVYAAVEAQDLETAGEYLAEDAVLVLIPPPPETDGTFVGKDAVLGWYENLIANNIAIEFSDAAVDGDRVTIKNLTWVDDLPLAPVEFDGSAIVQDGLIKTISWVITPESMAELDAAFERQANMAVVERYFEELWNQGDLDVIDEIIAEDFVSHSFPTGEGRDAMREMVTGFRENFPGVTIIVDQVIFEGNRAFVVSRIAGPDGASETAEGDIEDILVFDLEDGKITDRWYFVQPE